jgi:hypothetical protein
MTGTSVTRWVVITILVLIGLGAWTPAAAEPVRLGQTNSQAALALFDLPAVTGRDALDEPAGLADFISLEAGTVRSHRHAYSPVGTVLNADNWRRAWLWGAWPENGWGGENPARFDCPPGAGDDVFFAMSGNRFPARPFALGFDETVTDHAALRRQAVPEPSPSVFLAFSVGLFLLRWPKLRRRARA